MTAVCGGGTSAAKPGTDAIVRYSAGLIAAIFAAYDIAFLIPVIPLVGLVDIPLNAFCSSDPPAVPTFSSAETTALLNLDFGSDFDSGLSKMRDVVVNAIWWDACECTSGAPVGFIPPAPPSGTPIYQFPVGETSAPCGSAGPITHSFTTGNGTFNRGGVAVSTLSAPKIARIIVQNKVTSGAGWTLATTPRFELIAGGQTNLPQFFTPPNTTSIKDFVIPQDNTVNSFAITTNNVSGTGQLDEIKTWEIYCGNNVPGVQQPCCPPDPSTQSYLDNILQLVTLIQRQIVPFAHILGPSHSALTGQGTISVNGLLGVKLDLTTIPASYGVEVGSPDHHFDLGWLSVLTTDGFIDERRITAQLTAWLPRLMSDATVIGYSLNPGVVGTITELVREP